METCRFFAQGRCAFGTACRLSHDLPGGGAGDVGACGARAPQEPQRRGGGPAVAGPPGPPSRHQQDATPPPLFAPPGGGGDTWGGGGVGGGGGGAAWPDSESYFQDPSFGFGVSAAPAASSSGSWGGTAPREAEEATGSGGYSSGGALVEADAAGSPEMKEIRKVQKALREISSLEERRDAGESLQGNQLRKIEKKEEFSRKLIELEEALKDLATASAPPPPPLAAAEQPLPGGAVGGFSPPPSAPARKAPPPARPAPPPAPAGPVCRHFLAGRCSFGDACRNSHDVGAAGGAGTSGGAAGAAPRLVAQRPARPEEPAFDAEDPECGICFESIRKKGERFGILESCDHAFCLTCIRSWRRQREQQDRQNLRLCPVCRNESFFVVPSDEVFIDPDEKSRVIEQYKQEMARIPCKNFDYGRGSCPFGTSCFYAHLNPDGTRYVPPPLRWRNGADGSEVVGEVKLSDFLTRSLALS